MLVVGVEQAKGPVEQVERAVGAEEDDVEGRDDSGDCRLAEEEELREDADGFEDLGEGPEPLMGVSAVRISGVWGKLTSLKYHASLNIIMTMGERIRQPRRMTPPSFQATSRSRVRG
jgi:hypothetical protein